VKVFLDTNVWLSARFHTGLCARLLDGLIEADFDVLLDERVLEEFTRIARVKFQVGEPLLQRALVFFHQYARVVPAASEPLSGIRDTDDAYIIAAAVHAETHWFVTGDGELLKCAQSAAIEVIAPRAAYEKLISLR